MGKFTSIEWCSSTVNPTSGCDGCEILLECYARQVHENRLAHSYPDNYSRNFRDVRLIPGRMAAAALWGPLTAAEVKDKPWFKGRLRHIFVSDMSDALSEAVPFDFLKREIIDVVESKAGQRHVWQWLTKRPGRMAEFAQWMQRQVHFWQWPRNLWAGTSVTSQGTADTRVPELLKVPARVRFLSCEPLRGPVNLTDYFEVHAACANCGDMSGFGRCCDDPNHANTPAVDWVICGGESGVHAKRPMHPEWARSLRDQCTAAGVPFFFKQWGDWVPGNLVQNGNEMVRVGKKEAGRFLGDRQWNEIPSA